MLGSALPFLERIYKDHRNVSSVFDSMSFYCPSYFRNSSSSSVLVSRRNRERRLIVSVPTAVAMHCVLCVCMCKLFAIHLCMNLFDGFRCRSCVLIETTPDSPSQIQNIRQSGLLLQSYIKQKMNAYLLVLVFLLRSTICSSQYHYYYFSRHCR